MVYWLSCVFIFPLQVCILQASGRCWVTWRIQSFHDLRLGYQPLCCRAEQIVPPRNIWVPLSDGRHGQMPGEQYPVKGTHLALYVQHVSESKHSKSAVEEVVHALAWLHRVAGIDAVQKPCKYNYSLYDFLK